MFYYWRVIEQWDAAELLNGILGQDWNKLCVLSLRTNIPVEISAKLYEMLCNTAMIDSDYYCNIMNEALKVAKLHAPWELIYVFMLSW